MNVELMETLAQPTSRVRADSAESKYNIKKIKEISPATTVGQTVASMDCSENKTQTYSNGSSSQSQRDHNADAIISEAHEEDLNFLE